ncbi:MAG: hypothetical protein ACFCUQ_06240 [Kiloniellales bacterium]
MFGLVALSASGCAGVNNAADRTWMGNGPAKADLAQIGPILRVADATRARGDLATAAGLYQRAHELAPERVEPLIRLGFTLNQAGATVQAAEAFRMALQLESKNTEALRGLGLAMLQRNQVDLAIEQFWAALAIEEDPRLYNALGVAFDMKGDHVGAQTYYYTGLDVDPDSLALRTNLGLSLALSGNYAESISILDEVSRNPAASVQHRQTLALAYGLAGEVEAATQTGLVDLDAAAVERNLRYYEALRDSRQGAPRGS